MRNRHSVVPRCIFYFIYRFGGRRLQFSIYLQQPRMFTLASRIGPVESSPVPYLEIFLNIDRQFLLLLLFFDLVSIGMYFLDTPVVIYSFYTFHPSQSTASFYCLTSYRILTVSSDNYPVSLTVVYTFLRSLVCHYFFCIHFVVVGFNS